MKGLYWQSKLNLIFGGIIMYNEIDYVITSDGRRVSYEEFIEEQRANRN